MNKISVVWIRSCLVVVAWCVVVLLCGCFAARRADEILGEHGVTWEVDTTTGVVDGSASMSTGSTGSASGTSTSGGSMGLEEGMAAGASTGTTGATSGATTLAGETTQAALCGNGVVDEGESCDDGDEDASDGCNACVRESLVFVSSEHYQSKTLDGVFGADQRCRSLAAKAGLRRFETFKAWMSSTTESAADRLEHSEGRYVLVNGLVVANDWDELTSGTLQRPIEVTEKSLTLHWQVWTGTLPDGTIAFGSSQCSDWTSNSSEEGGIGHSLQKDGFWTFIEQGPCGDEASIYCVEQ